MAPCRTPLRVNARSHLPSCMFLLPAAPQRLCVKKAGRMHAGLVVGATCRTPLRVLAYVFVVSAPLRLCVKKAGRMHAGRNQLVPARNGRHVVTLEMTYKGRPFGRPYACSCVCGFPPHHGAADAHTCARWCAQHNLVRGKSALWCRR